MVVKSNYDRYARRLVLENHSRGITGNEIHGSLTLYSTVYNTKKNY